MANIINFSKAKKNLARNNKDQKARENRAKFGQSKIDKNNVIRENQQIEKKIDKHKLEAIPENDKD